MTLRNYVSLYITQKYTTKRILNIPITTHPYRRRDDTDIPQAGHSNIKLFMVSRFSVRMSIAKLFILTKGRRYQLTCDSIPYEGTNNKPIRSPSKKDGLSKGFRTPRRENSLRRGNCRRIPLYRKEIFYSGGLI